MAEFTSHLFPPFSSYYLTLPYPGLTVSASKPPTNYIHKHWVGTTSATSPPSNPSILCVLYHVTSHHDGHIRINPSPPSLPPSCPALFAFVRHLRPISPVTCIQGYDDDDLRYILPCKKLYVVLSVPFSCFWRKKKERRSEAKSLSYPPPVLFCPPLFCLVLATATLLHSLFSFFLFLVRISVQRERDKYIHT